MASSEPPFPPTRLLLASSTAAGTAGETKASVHMHMCMCVCLDVKLTFLLVMLMQSIHIGLCMLP